MGGYFDVKEEAEKRKKSGEKTSYFDVRKEAIAKEIEGVASSISQRTQTWLQNHNNYLTNYNDRYSSRTGTYEDSYVSDAGDWLSTISTQKENFDKEASSILSMLDKYGDYLDPNWAKSIRETLTTASSQQADILKYSTSDSEYWSQFANEQKYAFYQDYNRTQKRLADYQKKYEGKSYDEIQGALGEMEDGEEKDWLSAYQFEVLKGNADYESRATSGWEKYLADQQAKEQAQQKTREDESFWESLGRWLGPTGAVDTSIPLANVPEITQNLSKDYSYQQPKDTWTDEQKAMYGYLYDSGAGAEQYAQITNEANNQAENQKKIAAIEEWSTKNGWTGAAATLASVALMPLSLADTLSAITEYNARGFVSTSADPMPGQISNAITGAISTVLNEKSGTINEKIPVLGGKGLGDAYQLGTSIANSILSGYTQGGLGTYMVFFGSASASAMYDAKDRGATDEQAITFGILNGLAEAAGEAFSIEKLLKIGDSRMLRDFFVNVLKQSGVEASEEGVTTLLNNFSEQLVLGDKSNFNMLVSQYMTEEGLSESEAKKKAWISMANDLAFDMLGGFISGGVSSGLQTGVQTMFVNHTENQNAQQIYGSDPGALVSEALEIDPDNSYAQKMQQYLDSGKQLSGQQLNRLVQQNEAALAAQENSGQQSPDRSKQTRMFKRRRKTRGYSEQDAMVDDLMSGPDSTEDAQPAAWDESVDLNSLSAEEYMRLLEAAQQPQKASEITGEQVAAETQNEAQSAQAATAEAAQTPAGTVLENQTVDQTAENGKIVDTASMVTGKNTLQVAEDGVTRQVSTGKEVTPRKVVSIEGSKAVIQTDDGTISADDIQFGTSDTDMLWRSAVQFNGITPASANGVIRAYRSGDSVTTYISGAAQEFKNGYYNLPSGGEYADKLTPMQRTIIHELGKKAAGENTAKAHAVAKNATPTKKGTVAKKQKETASKTETVGKVHFERNGRTFDETREVSLKTMEQLSAALGVEFYVFESYVNEAGKRVYKDANGNEVPAPNGYYDPKDGSIHIDLNAGVDGKGTMLFTIAHELTHFIKQWSPAKFKVLANFLVKQYGEKGVSVNKLVDAQIAKAKKNGREIAWEDAYEEVVADSMEAMLTDGNVVQMMADLKQQDRTLWQKICDWFKDLADDLKALVGAYAGVKPDSREGKMVAKMQDVIVILESLYADALADAGGNYQAHKAQKNTTREGGVDSNKYSIRDGMTEQERYEDLKDKKITVISDNRAANYSEDIASLEALQTKAKSKAEKIIKPLAKKLGIINTPLSTADVETEFLFTTSGGLAESMHKQLRYGGSYVDFAKTLINLDHVLETAVLIEVHGDKYAQTTRANEKLEAVYVLFSAFRDGNSIIPVQMEIKKSSDAGGRLYLTVAMTKIEADVVGSAPGNIQAPSLLPASEHSLAEIFSKINPQDKHFLKYLPDGFLSGEQIKAKNAAMAEDAVRIMGYASKKIEASPPRGSLLRASSGVPNASGERVAQDADGVKEKFSLRDTVEYTKDLVAVHNLSEEKLIKSLRLGGLPMPSIAVLRAQDGHSEFGEISLVFDKDTIDPQAYRTNKLYSGDAWTPTYPRVDYKVNEKVRKNIRDKIGKLVPAEIRNALGRIHLDSDNMEDTLNRYDGNMVDAFKNDDGMKYAYLMDAGEDITLPMKEEDLARYGSISNAAVRYFSGKLVNGLQTVEMYQNMGSRELLSDKALAEAVADAHNWDVLRTMEPGSDEYLAYEQNPLFHADEVSFSEIDRLLSATRKLFTSGVQQTVDTSAARSLIKDSVDQYAYEAWLKELFSGIVEKEGIRNDRDYFTPSGNRRSFEALHYEHNLENVIKEMREKGEKGIGALGGGSIFGAATTEFSSIEGMKQASDRLQKIPEEEYQKLRDAFSNRFFELASSLPNNKNSFSAVDDAANMLVEAVSRYTTKSGMANYIRRESQGWATYNDYVVDDLIELVRDIRNMPTGYFEAKPRRAVGFDEVATAIVPDSVSDELRTKLEDMGIHFVEYAAGDEEARKTVLNSLEDVKFSDRDSDGNELSKEQQEYFKDSKVRDEQGRLLAMYHGTPNGGFTKFRSGTYFTQNPGYADVYQNPGASSISSKKGAEAPMTYKVYLDIQKPFDTRNTKERRIFMEEFYRKYGTGTPLADSGLPDWVDGMDLQEFVEEMEYDYDGLILDEGGVGGYGDEVVSRGMSYVVFSPEQVKNVDNKTPTDDPDIRYSERDPELEKVNRILTKENAELKYDIAYLKELLKLQKQVTGGTRFTKSSVEAAAVQLMKYANAKGDKAELVPMLNSVYEYIAGGEELTWDGVMEKAQPAVQWLKDHAYTKKQLDGYAQDILREVRGSRIYLDELQKKEVAYQYGSYNDYRKQAMGSITITEKSSVSLDTKWQEWSSSYPNIFDPETTTNDMPAALMDAIDSLRNMTDMDIYGYDEELAEQDILRQVYDSYWNVSTLYTVADAKQKEINKLKYEHSKRMHNLREFHREKTAQLKAEHREALQKVKQAERERAERKQQEITERYRESRQKGAENRRKTEMRRKIRKTIMDLNKILNKGDKKRNVKEDMKDLVSEALRTADILFTDTYTGEDMVRDGVGTEMTEQEAKYMTEAQNILAEIERAGTAQERQEAEDRLRGKLDYRISKLQDVFTRERARLNKTKVSEVLGNLADAYASLENSEYSYVSGAFDENVHQYLLALRGDVGGTIVKDMSLNQLEELHRAYTMVLTTVRNANKMFAANLRQTREQLGSQTIGEVKQAGGEHGLWLPGEDKVNTFSWNNQKPVYAFERIGSPTLTKLFENTRAGEDSWAQDMTEAREYYLNETRKYKYDSWDFEKQYKFTSTSGIDFSLNLEQIMSLYAYSKREQAHAHLMKGGFVFDGNTEVQVNKMGIKLTYLNKTAKAHNVSPEILGEIVSKLTAEQKAFVDEMQDYLSTTMGEKGNEVSMQLYGVKLFKEKHYFPLRSAGQYMAKAKEADLKKQQGQVSIVNSGFTKATTPKSSNPVVLSSFMDVWADHVNEMSMYHSFVLPMEDFRRVYNYASPNMETGQSISVNSVIQDAYGSAATDYIDQLYRDLNGGAVADPRDTPIKALMGNFKKAAVFASASVVIQQPSAIGRAFAIIDPKYFIGSKVDHKRHKALWAELKQYAPVAAIKEMGYFDTGMGKSAQDFIKGKEYNSLKEKAAAIFTDGDYRDKLLSKAPALADELTWCTIWEAAKRETKAKNPGMRVTSEEFLQLSGKRFTEVVTKTQVYDSVLSRSANMRSKGLMTMWTAFMAEPTTTINMIEDALRKGKRGDKKHAAKAMGAVLSSVILNSLLVSLVNAMRDDDEDETFLEKYVQSFVTEILDGINPVTYYPFLKDIWSVLQGYDIERSDMSLIDSLVEKITKLVQVYNKDTEGMDEEEEAAYNKDLADAWWGVVDYATALAGIPVKNVRRDINAAVNTVKTIGEEMNGRDTSWGSLIDKTWDAVKNNLPVVGWMSDASTADKLYKATVSGDTAYQKRLASSYKTENSLDNAIRKGLRANDSRIWEAAIAWNNNDLDTYKRIAKEIVTEGNFSQDNVVMAIRAEASAMIETESSSSTSKAKGYFTAEKFTVAIAQGNGTMAATIKADIIETAKKNGKTAQEAEKSFASTAKSNLKELFLEGGVTAAQSIDALTKYCGVEEEDAQDTVLYWDFLVEYPDYSNLNQSAVANYYEYAATAGISMDTYYEYCQQKAAYSLKADILEVIDSLNLTKDQKDALYFANGWVESTLYEAPWN